MAGDELTGDVARIVADFLRDSPAAHRRRVAIRQGRVEPSETGCDHADWDHARQWCDGCGVTLRELVMRAGP